MKAFVLLLLVFLSCLSAAALLSSVQGLKSNERSKKITFASINRRSVKHDGGDDDDDAMDPDGGHDHGTLMGLPPYAEITNNACKMAYAGALTNSYECHGPFNTYVSRLIKFEVTRSVFTQLCTDRECFSTLREAFKNLVGNCTGWFRPGVKIPSFDADLEDILCSKSSSGSFCAEVLTVPSFVPMNAMANSSSLMKIDTPRWNLTLMNAALNKSSSVCDSCNTDVINRLRAHSVYKNFVTREQIASHRLLCMKDETYGTLCGPYVRDVFSYVVGGSEIISLDESTLSVLAPHLCVSTCITKALSYALTPEIYNRVSTLCYQTDCWALWNVTLGGCALSLSSSNLILPPTCNGQCKSQWLEAEDTYGCCFYSFIAAYTPSQVSSVVGFHKSCHDQAKSSDQTSQDPEMNSCQLIVYKKINKNIRLLNLKFSFYSENSAVFKTALIKDLAYSYSLAQTAININQVFSSKSDQVGVIFSLSLSDPREFPMITNIPTCHLTFNALSAAVSARDLLDTTTTISAEDSLLGQSSASASLFSWTLSSLLCLLVLIAL